MQTEIDVRRNHFDDAEIVEYGVFQTRYVTRKVNKRQLDLLIEFGETPRYWINPESPKAYFVEIALRESESKPDSSIAREPISGAPVSYADWVLPGILGMNMMFSCLFGVGVFPQIQLAT